MFLIKDREFKEGVSVIVNTLNDQDNIGAMLESISKSKPDQIVVIDGESSDTTVEIAKRYTNDVFVIPKGILRQQKVALENVEFQYLIVLECDHRYPEGFISNMLNEYSLNYFFGLQASLECYYQDTFFEKGMNAFYKIHQMYKGEKDIIGGPGIWSTKEYIHIFNIMNQIQGYSADTTRAEILKQNKLKVGLGHTVVYQYQHLTFKIFFKKYFNYGKGDYDFYNTHKKEWSLQRKLKSIFHVFNRYVVDYPIKSFKVAKPHIAIPYLWLSAIVRYSGWVYSIFKNSNVSK
jgi:glycosyltransferase involved in cell wall biosynthesis